MLNLKKYAYSFVVLLLLNACSIDKSQQSQSDLITRISQARVVFVGETHTNYAHHLNQLEIIQKTHQKWGGVLSIGLEMVQQPYQAYLDDYIAGKISEREMLRGVQWYSRWRYDFRLYRLIFAYAKKHNIPLIALNIPQELSKRISKEGIAGLKPYERQSLPDFIDRSNSNYTARLKKVFGLHAHGKKFNQQSFNRFVDAQLAWDEGMAFAASNYLKKHTNERMLILAGTGHLIKREGIPSRMDRQLKLSAKLDSVVVLSHSDGEPYSKQDADFSLPTKHVELPPAGKMGIAMKDTDVGVIVTTALKKGAAFKAGLRKGDILLALNQTKISSSSDVLLLLLDKKPNEKIAVLIRRGT